MRAGVQVSLPLAHMMKGHRPEALGLSRHTGCPRTMDNAPRGQKQSCRRSPLFQQVVPAQNNQLGRQAARPVSPGPVLDMNWSLAGAAGCCESGHCAVQLGRAGRQAAGLVRHSRPKSGWSHPPACKQIQNALVVLEVLGALRPRLAAERFGGAWEHWCQCMAFTPPILYNFSFTAYGRYTQRSNASSVASPANQAQIKRERQAQRGLRWHLTCRGQMQMLCGGLVCRLTGQCPVRHRRLSQAAYCQATRHLCFQSGSHLV